MTLTDIEKDTNYKEMLRRYCMRTKIPLPDYTTYIQDDGVVACTCKYGHKDTSYGTGINKKRAEMSAAYQALITVGYEDVE